jgi:mono/diheme cytochrome c family protein
MIAARAGVAVSLGHHTHLLGTEAIRQAGVRTVKLRGPLKMLIHSLSESPGPEIARIYAGGRSSMKKAFSVAVVFALAVPMAVAQEKRPAPAQALRGRELFLRSPKGTACATCHNMDGAGTAVGPDLSRLASVATPHSMVATIKMTMTNEVLLVKTADGKFPGILKQKQGDDLEIWDLSKMPPVLQKLTSKQITSMDRDTVWRHPPALADYNAQELADIIGFLRWASTGSQKEIKAADVDDSQ